jgi:hypothetical protein
MRIAIILTMRDYLSLFMMHRPAAPPILTQTVSASNATLVIDGISISKASNKITDALEGVTLDLLKANARQHNHFKLNSRYR